MFHRIQKYLRKIGWDKQCANLLTKLCTYDKGLPQGAPTSPKLSNLANYVIDATPPKEKTPHSPTPSMPKGDGFGDQ